MSQPMVIAMGTIKGYKVRNPAGEDLGKLEDLVIDDEGRVLYGVLSYGGVLHVSDKLAAVPWKRLRILGGEKTFILDMDKQLLQEAPHFNRDSWPDMSLPEWRNRVDSYFTYKPPEERQESYGAEFTESGLHAVPVGQTLDDERILRRVEFELSAANAFNMDAIQVSCRNGYVSLAGRVSSQAESILADNTARATEGVRGVRNNLNVSKVA